MLTKPFKTKKVVANKDPNLIQDSAKLRFCTMMTPNNYLILELDCRAGGIQAISCFKPIDIDRVNA